MANTHDIATILPAAGYVIVEPSKLPGEVSGIYNPNKDKEVPQWGMVVAVGKYIVKQGEMSEFNAKKGSTVIYKKWGGNEVEVGGKHYYFLKFEEIIGVVV